MDAEISDLEIALRGAIRQGDFNAKALIEAELLVRDLRMAIEKAVELLDRKNYQLARIALKQALDEMPWPQRRRER